MYHVLNRGNGRMNLFHKDGDFLAFKRVLAEGLARYPVDLLTYCLMPNHWHLVLWPEKDGELSEFMRLLTVTHTQRWHAHYHSAGTGPLYQGRFKSFPIERDEHLLTVLRYVERNPLRAKMVERAEDWRWSSLGLRRLADVPKWLLPGDRWPLRRRDDWLAWVNRSQTMKEVDAIRVCVKRGRPYGSDRWIAKTAAALSLQSTLRPRGRPGKQKAANN